jgi:hypothetical protein
VSGKDPQGALDYERHCTVGALGTPVKCESSAEKAAKEQARLLKEQNELLATLARNNQRPPRPPVPIPHEGVKCCLDCINQRCDKAMGDEVGWTCEPVSVAAGCTTQVARTTPSRRRITIRSC